MTESPGVPSRGPAAPAPRPPVQRLAAGYFLAFGLAALLFVAWLRGVGRIVLPLLLVVLLVVVVVRVLRAVMRPLP